MDGEPYRCKWYDMTGREQSEWIKVWEDNNRPHEEMKDLTRGLRGTDPNEVTGENLAQVLAVSPSFRKRRPAGHEVSQATVDGVRRNLYQRFL